MISQSNGLHCYPPAYRFDFLRTFQLDWAVYLCTVDLVLSRKKIKHLFSSGQSSISIQFVFTQRFPLILGNYEKWQWRARNVGEWVWECTVGTKEGPLWANETPCVCFWGQMFCRTLSILWWWHVTGDPADCVNHIYYSISMVSTIYWFELLMRQWF